MDAKRGDLRPGGKVPARARKFAIPRLEKGREKNLRSEGIRPAAVRRVLVMLKAGEGGGTFWDKFGGVRTIHVTAGTLFNWKTFVKRGKAELLCLAGAEAASGQEDKGRKAGQLKKRGRCRKTNWNIKNVAFHAKKRGKYLKKKGGIYGDGLPEKTPLLLRRGGDMRHKGKCQKKVKVRKNWAEAGTTRKLLGKS